MKISLRQRMLDDSICPCANGILLRKWNFTIQTAFGNLATLGKFVDDNVCIGGVWVSKQIYRKDMASPEAGRGNCLPYVLAPPSLSCESGG